MIVLSWSKATRDLLKSLGWGIRALHQLGTATMVPSPRRLPHTISPLEGAGKRPLATAAMPNNVAPRLCRRVAKHAPNASRARDTGSQKRDRWFESVLLQRRDGIGQAARTWHHRRFSHLL